MHNAMDSDRSLGLDECTAFAWALRARPPAIVHGTAALLAGLLGTGLFWAALTKADLVVRAPGRVRPESSPTKVFFAGRDAAVNGNVWGRVIEANFRQGQRVRQGQVLLRLDAERLGNDIAARERAIHTAEEELARLHQFETLLERQFEETRGSAEADVRLAQVELEVAQDREARLRLLRSREAISEVAYAEAAARLRRAREELTRARVSLALAERDYQLKREELALKRTLKEGELATARPELANLELERKRAVIHSPVDGVVTSEDIHVGDVLQAGQPAVEIAEQRGFRFDVVVPNEDMAHLKVGMPARVKLEAYDYQEYGVLKGTVRFISPDSDLRQGEQAPFYIVRIELDGDEVGRGDHRGRVKLGMAGHAEIVSAQKGILSLFLRKVQQSISLG